MVRQCVADSAETYFILAHLNVADDAILNRFPARGLRGRTIRTRQQVAPGGNGAIVFNARRVTVPWSDEYYDARSNRDFLHPTLTCPQHWSERWAVVT